MKSYNGWVPLVEITWEAGYPSPPERRGLVKFVNEYGVDTCQISLPSGGQKAWAVKEEFANDLVALLKLRRDTNLSPETRAKIIANARAVRAAKARDTTKQTPVKPPQTPEMPRETINSFEQLDKPLYERRALDADRTPQQEFEVTVRKLIALCGKLGVDTLTIQDGKAEIVRSVTVTKEETIKG